MDIKQAMVVGFLAKGTLIHSSRRIAEVINDFYPDICPDELRGNQLAGMELVHEAQHELESWAKGYERCPIRDDPFNYEWDIICEITGALNALEELKLVDISTYEQALLLKSIYTQMRQETAKLDWEKILKQAWKDTDWEGEPSLEAIKQFQIIFDT